MSYSVLFRLLLALAAVWTFLCCYHLFSGLLDVLPAVTREMVITGIAFVVLDWPGRVPLRAGVHVVYFQKQRKELLEIGQS